MQQNRSTPSTEVTDPTPAEDHPAEGLPPDVKLVRARAASMKWFDNSYFVEPIIRPGTVVLLQGPPNSMKTWAALDAMRAIASGTRWLDRFQCVQGMCLGLFLDSPSEDVLSQWRRLTQAQEEEFAKHALASRDWEAEKYELGIPDDEGDPDAGPEEPLHDGDEAYFSPFNDLARFWWPQDSTHLYETAQYGAPVMQPFAALLDRVIQETTHRHSTLIGSALQEDDLAKYGEYAILWRALAGLRNVGVQHVFIDSLSKVHGLNENDNMQMEAVVGLLQRLARSTKVCIWVLHHWAKPSDSGGYEGSIYSGRGASRIPDGADVIFNFMPERGEPKVKVEQVKVRGKRVAPFMVELVTEGDPEADNDFLLDQSATIRQALKDGVPHIIDPAKHTFARARLKQADLGTKACMRLVAHIGQKGSITATEGRAWAARKVGLEEPLTEAGKSKVSNYFRNRLKEATRLGLVVSETKGVYKLTTGGVGKLARLDPTELAALNADDDSADD